MRREKPRRSVDRSLLDEISTGVELVLTVVDQLDNAAKVFARFIFLMEVDIRPVLDGSPVCIGDDLDIRMFGIGRINCFDGSPILTERPERSAHERVLPKLSGEGWRSVLFARGVGRVIRLVEDPDERSAPRVASAGTGEAVRQ